MAEHEEKFKFTSEGADKVANDFEKVAKSQEKSDEATQKQGKSLADLGGAVIAAQAAWSALNAVIFESIDLYAEVDAEQGRVTRNLKQIGLDSKQAQQELKKLNAQFRSNLKFGVGILDQTKAYRKLLDATKDQALAESDLALAIDIQADGITDLAGAAEALKKARQGDTGVLRELNVVTKDQEAALAGIKNEAGRVEVIMRLLSDEYNNAAVENQGLADKMAETEEQMNAVKIATGELVGKAFLGTLGLIDTLVLTNEELDAGITFLDKFANGMSNLSKDASNAATNIGHFFSEFSTEDAKNFFFGGKSFTEQVQTIAGRGAARAASGPTSFDSFVRAGKAAGTFGSAGQEPGGLSKDDLIGLASEAPQGPGLDGSRGGPAERQKSEVDEFKATKDQIFQAQLNHDSAMLKLQMEQEEALAKMIEDGHRAREEARRKEFDDETAAIVRANEEKRRQEDEEVRIKRENQKKFNDIQNERRQNTIDDIALGSDFVATGAEVAAGFIENEKAKLAFEAIAASARAAVTFALAFTPPPVGGPQYLPGAIAQAAAAVGMAAKAGQGGGGVQSKASPPGGSASPNPSPATSAPSVSDQQTLQTFGSGNGGVFSNMGADQINIFATFGPSPEDARNLVDAIETERRRRS